MKEGLLKMRYDKIQFAFVENENLGLSKDQIVYIKKLIENYIEEYPHIVLTKVCDYFSWDYLKSELSEYTYTHNRENEAYAEYDNVAQYSDEQKLIGFNHIQMSKMELDNKQIVEAVERDKKRLEKVKKEYEKVRRQCRLLGQPVPSFNKILNGSFSSSELKRHEIETKELTDEYLEVMLIRCMEECKSVRGLVAHEVGHAIAYSYHLEEDETIKALYEKFEDGFENIQEFVAECFMASELTGEIPLANKVKKRIGEIAGL